MAHCPDDLGTPHPGANRAMQARVLAEYIAFGGWADQLAWEHFGMDAIAEWRYLHNVREPAPEWDDREPFEVYDFETFEYVELETGRQTVEVDTGGLL